MGWGGCCLTEVVGDCGAFGLVESTPLFPSFFSPSGLSKSSGPLIAIGNPRMIAPFKVKASLMESLL